MARVVEVKGAARKDDRRKRLTRSREVAKGCAFSFRDFASSRESLPPVVL